jgi:hypothetical protein
MSLRPLPGVQPRVGRQSRRLDEVLRAGQAHCQENETDPTGVVGPLLSNLPATVTRLPGRNVPQPSSTPRPNVAPVPGTSPNQRKNPPFKTPTLQYADHVPLEGAMARGISYNGEYTGQGHKGKPYGEGTLVVNSAPSARDAALKIAIERAAPLREEYMKLKAQQDKLDDYAVADPERAAELAPQVDRKLRAAWEALRAARAEVARLDPLPVASYTALHDEVLSSIGHKLYDAMQEIPFGKWDDSIPTFFLRWFVLRKSRVHLFGWDGAEKWPELEWYWLIRNIALHGWSHWRKEMIDDFNKHWDETVAPFASGEPRDNVVTRWWNAGLLNSVQNPARYEAMKAGLKETAEQPYFRPGDLKRYAEAVNRGEVDFYRAPTPTPPKLSLSGWWYEGQLTDGVIKTEKTMPGGEKMNLAITVLDDRPFGLTRNEASLHEEVRGRNGKLLHEIYVENIERVDGWLYGATLSLSGRIRWSARPTEHKFEWAASMEEVNLRNGKGTLDIDLETEQPLANPVLSGRAEVRLNNAETGARVWLYGEMVDNRLMGVVTRRDESTGSDDYIYIEGYGGNGVPVTRLPTEKEKSESDMVPRGEPPPYDKDLDEAVVGSQPSDPGYSLWSAAFATLVLLIAGIKMNEDADPDMQFVRKLPNDAATLIAKTNFIHDRMKSGKPWRHLYEEFQRQF